MVMVISRSLVAAATVRGGGRALLRIGSALRSTGLVQPSGPILTRGGRRCLTSSIPRRGPSPGTPTPGEGSPGEISNRSILREMLLFSPLSTLAGITIGGLGATLAAILYFLHMGDVVNAKEVLSDLRQYRLVLQHMSETGLVDPTEAERLSQAATMTAEQATRVTEASPSTGSGGVPTWLSVPVSMLAPAICWTLGFLVTSSIAFTRARVRLRMREHMRQVNFSLTSFDRQSRLLKIRTLQESTMDVVLPDNQAAVDLVLDCARRTSSAQPFVALPKRQHFLIMNSLLNIVAPKYSHGYVREDMGLPTHSALYWIGLSFRYETPKARKLRVIVASDELLRRVQLGEEMPHLEDASHDIRWQTLTVMADILKQQEAGEELCGPGKNCIIKLHPITLSIPAYAGDVRPAPLA
ncbi:uncharacterized protein MONBRDRAFT_33862 [Monosiga brevicollis MX1]|uniref:Uncharacterized protein n=1 Tax=Monosiga brevicollis TaxID=81824 RepID=A9V7Z8_MONBE|nr:uncharacterized protein MONBRDRAFT_33862 [Monosiga brevicollis MX1]EDQ86463.1 predicted protein [Monosiga brevicollis MX1]|eukprot:XP_001748853.1 hypothetical protein [Monosiga brevicollis MX1]